MKKRIKAYLAFIDMILDGKLPVTATFDINGEHKERVKKDVAPTRKEYDLLISRHQSQIAFFQHERLIHLMVTLIFALLTFIVFIANLFLNIIGLYILMLALIVLLIPYIMHYYLLENGVQKMYSQYDEMVKRAQE